MSLGQREATTSPRARSPKAHRAVATLLIAAVVCIAWPSAADARKSKRTPCADLERADYREYNRLVALSAQRYQSQDYAGAVESILELKRICDEDPRLDFNLARAYQRGGNCNMATFWFEYLLERIADDPRALAEEKPQLAQEALEELGQQCAESSRITFAVANPDAIVELVRLDQEAERVTLSAPFSGRIDAGTYRVTTTSPGHQTTEQIVTIVSVADNIVAVPALLPADITGTVTFHCPPSVTSVAIVFEGRQDSEQDAECGTTMPLADGEWHISFQVTGHHFVESLTVTQNRHTDLKLTSPAAPQRQLGTEGWGWVSVGAGSAMLAGGGLLLGTASLAEVDVLEPTETDPATGEVLDVRSTTRDPDGTAANLRTAGYIIGGAGAAVLVTGVVLLVVANDNDTDDASATQARTHFSTAVLPSGGMLIGLGGSF